MSNMKDYMEWLVDRGFATAEDLMNGQRTLAGRDIYGEELTSEYQEDSEWHPDDDDEDDFIDDEDEDAVNGELDDDELGDIQMKVDTVKDLIDLVFSDDPSADKFRDLIDTDMLTRLWGISEDIRHLNEEDEHGWTEDEYWFNESGGLTADAENYLHTLDSRGELV